MNQDTFDLNAVDWSSVGMMRGAFLSADRDYIEEKQRLLLSSTDRYGIAAMSENSLLVFHQQDEETRRMRYGITLASCQAITPGGYLVSIVNDPEGRICTPCVGDLTLHPVLAGNKIPIYLGVKRHKEAVKLTPARQQQLKEIRFLQARYVVSTTQREPDVEDWLCIGQMEYDASGFREDLTYVPECLRLDSMPRLIDASQRVRTRAEACQAQLRKHLESRKAEAGPMAAAMSEAAVMIDRGARPRAYLERLYTVLRIENELRFLIPYGGIHQKIENGLNEALTRLPEELAKRETDCDGLLRLIEKALGLLEEAYCGWDAGIAPSETPGGDVIFEEVQMQEVPQGKALSTPRQGLFDGWKKGR